MSCLGLSESRSPSGRVAAAKPGVIETFVVGQDEREWVALNAVTFADHPDGTLLEMTTHAKALTELGYIYLNERKMAESATEYLQRAVQADPDYTYRPEPETTIDALRKIVDG